MRRWERDGGNMLSVAMGEKRERKVRRAGEPEKIVNSLQVMDSEIWQYLPQDLLFRILALLPWWSNLPLRSVCSEWRNRLASLEFLMESGQSSVNSKAEERSWICYSGVTTYTIKNWSRSRSLLLSWTLQTFKVEQNVVQTSQVEQNSIFHLESATRGLLLITYQSQTFGRRRFLLNPLNRTQREIPLLPTKKEYLRYSLGMVYDNMSRSHKITVIHTSGQDPAGLDQKKMYVYDLSTSRWDLVHCGKSEYDDLRRPVKAVFFNQKLYILKVLQLEGSWIYQLFHVLPTRLETLSAKFTLDKNSNVEIFEYGGSLMMVCETQNRRFTLNFTRYETRNRRCHWNSTRCMSLCIWKLHGSMSDWEETFVMPHKLGTILRHSGILLRLYAN